MFQGNHRSRILIDQLCRSRVTRNLFVCPALPVMLPGCCMMETEAKLTAETDERKTPPSKAFARPELLAPAGDWECAKAAVENGADAIYFGLERFNARMRAHNFTEADLPQLDGISAPARREGLRHLQHARLRKRNGRGGTISARHHRRRRGRGHRAGRRHLPADPPSCRRIFRFMPRRK